MARKGGKKGTKKEADTEAYNKLNKNKSFKPNRSRDHSLMFLGGKEQEAVGQTFLNESEWEAEVTVCCALTSEPLNLCTLPPGVGRGQG